MTDEQAFGHYSDADLSRRLCQHWEYSRAHRAAGREHWEAGRSAHAAHQWRAADEHAEAAREVEEELDRRASNGDDSTGGRSLLDALFD